MALCSVVKSCLCVNAPGLHHLNRPNSWICTAVPCRCFEVFLTYLSCFLMSLLRMGEYRLYVGFGSYWPMDPFQHICS